MCINCALNHSSASGAVVSATSTVNAGADVAARTAGSPVDAIRGNYTAPSVIDVFIPTSSGTVKDAFGSPVYTTDALLPAAYEAFLAAMDLIESVTNIDFRITTNPGAADWMLFSADYGDPGLLGYFGTGPQNLTWKGITYRIDGHGYFNTGASSWDEQGLQAGGGGFTTILHELLHGLGLGHTHDGSFGTNVMAGVESPFSDYGAANLNQGVYTVMSYNDGVRTHRESHSYSDNYGNSSGLGALDIAALQQKYGKASHATGNDTYVLDTTNGAGGNGTGYEAIWDSGGVDTISAAGSDAASCCAPRRNGRGRRASPRRRRPEPR